MGLESASHIDELVNTNPVGATDPKSAGDDHLRMIKVVLQNDFPDVDQATSSIIQSNTAPPLARPGTFWFDTAANLFKIRNEADDAWITLALSAVASNTVDINAGTIDGATIAGGTIDNTPIGGSTPAAGDFSTLTTTGLATVESLTVTNEINQLPSGTVAAFFQASAPTTWTQVVTQNDKAIRIVSGTGGGTGGTVAFETAFASQSVTGTNTGTGITQAQLASHAHVQQYNTTSSGIGIEFISGGAATPVTLGVSTQTTGSGSTHTHTFTGDAIDLDVSYINMLLASKD